MAVTGDRARRWSVLALVLAAALGAVAATAVDRLVLDDEDVDGGAGNATLTPDDLGAGWALDATTSVGGGDGPGLLNGCAAEGGADGRERGAFTALSDATGDVITSEIRVASNTSNAAQLFQAAASVEATECVRRTGESESVEQFGAGAPVVAAVEPLETTPWADQAAAYRIRIDVGGVPTRWVDIHVMRQGHAVAVLQIIDQGEAMADEPRVQAVRALVEGIVEDFGSR